MLIDTHAHLSDSRFVGEVDEVIERAKMASIETIICQSSNLLDAKKVVDLTSCYQEIYGCVGLYPGEGQKNPNWRKDLVELKTIIAQNPRIVGIGEIGLDIYWLERDEKKEREMFLKQIELANQLDKPVVIHNRQCHEIIKELISGLDKVPRGVFHCFSGDENFLRWVVEQGFFVGFGGNITYPSNRELRELLKLVPIDKLLLETDSPYLPPQGKRGERNEPANVRITGQLIAELRGVTLEELGKQTSDNANKLFSI